jgi:hypothetical protein
MFVSPFLRMEFCDILFFKYTVGFFVIFCFTSSKGHVVANDENGWFWIILANLSIYVWNFIWDSNSFMLLTINIFFIIRMILVFWFWSKWNHEDFF